MRCHLLAAAAAIVPLVSVPTPDPVDLVVDQVRGAAVKAHLAAFQRIADQYGDTRASGTPGYDASASYVASRLRAAGYQVREQAFTFPFYREIEKPVLRRGRASHLVKTLEYSPSSEVRAKARPVGANGCVAADYRGAQGSIALVQRGECSFRVKADLAQAAGAVGVIVVNTAADAPDGTLSKPGLRIPVVAVGQTTGPKISGKQVRLRVRTESEDRVTRNVIADSPGGRADRTIVLGAHLDSVIAGPGINDNGSGSAGLLEVALRMHAVRPANKLRFAWWGAEELGLLGSTHYVSQLPPDQYRTIAAYLNFDMIASTNFTYGIYDGDDSDAVGAGPGPAGSAQIEKDFEGFFRSRRLPFVGTDFSGRSDYGPFIKVGIPAGGLFTGAEGLKTAAEAEKFGGTAGQPFDSCYHKACDNITNLNDTALDVNSDAIATLAATYAFKAPSRN
ncbi:M28 family metallopeptidase [Streptosporangium sp. KLBMP 9127]|nr:M28 family metallopeptidase [Streptosporangium sp. KLBMP 9127]